MFCLGSIPFFVGTPIDLLVSLLEGSSINFSISSKSGIDARIEVNALNESCNGGVSFNAATAIVAKNGTISISIKSFCPVMYGKRPIAKIKVIPKGSINDRGNSGKTSAFQMKGKEFLLANLYFFQSKVLS